VKAANATRMTTRIYAPLAGLQGAPAMIGAAGANRVHSINFWHPNIENTPMLANANAFKAKYKEDFAWLPFHVLPELLTQALRKAGSDEPRKVADALRTVRYKGPTAEVWIRPEDHQIIMPIYATLFSKAGQPGVQYDAENTTYGWKTEGYFDAAKNQPAILCRITPP